MIDVKIQTDTILRGRRPKVIEIRHEKVTLEFDTEELLAFHDQVHSLISRVSGTEHFRTTGDAGELVLVHALRKGD